MKVPSIKAVLESLYEMMYLSHELAVSQQSGKCSPTGNITPRGRDSEPPRRSKVAKPIVSFREDYGKERVIIKNHQKMRQIK